MSEYVTHFKVYGKTACEITHLAYMHRKCNLVAKSENSVLHIDSMYKKSLCGDIFFMAEDDEVCYIGREESTVAPRIGRALAHLIDQLKNDFSSNEELTFYVNNDIQINEQPLTISQLEHILNQLKKPTFENKVEDPFLILARRKFLKDFTYFTYLYSFNKNMPPILKSTYFRFESDGIKKVLYAENIKESFINELTNCFYNRTYSERERTEAKEAIHQLAESEDFNNFATAVPELKSMGYDIDKVFYDKCAYSALLNS